MIKINGILALAYCLGGYFGTMLAIPPSYVSPVWPAAGIAFAGLVIYGRRVIIGIGLGALATQMLVFWDTSTVKTCIDSGIIGVAAGISATAQAVLGAWLARRYVGVNNPLIDDRSILLFMTLGGPVSCVISASAGVATLFLKGAVDLRGVLSSWITWWIGDTVGVLAFAPVLLCFWGKPRNIWYQRINSVAWPLFCLSALVLVILHFGKQHEQARIRTLFEQRSNLLHAALQNVFRNYVDDNQDVKALFDSSNSITRTEFRSFSENVLNDHPYNQVLEWIPRITGDQRPDFEQQLGIVISRQKTDGAEVLQPSPPQAEYFPIVYVEPYNSNKAVQGFDITSNSRSFAAAKNARDSGRTAVSRIIPRVGDSKKQAIVVLYSPVYQGYTPAMDQAQRRQRLLGVVATEIRIDDNINAILRQFKPLQLQLTISDDEDLLFDDAVQTSAQMQRFLHPEKSLHLSVADRSWSVVYSPAPLFYAEQLSSNIEWLILGGFLLISLSGVGLLMLTGRTLQTEAVVETRTQALKQEITERAAAEQKNNRLTQLYALLGQCNQAIVRCTTREALCMKLCTDAVQIGGMKMAWVGIYDPVTKRVSPIASFRENAGCQYDIMAINLDKPYITGPVATAIRENRPVWCQDFLKEPNASTWLECSAQCGWVALGVLPIRNNDAVVGAFNLYAGQPDAFDEAIQALLVEMAMDISFAFDNFDREAKRLQAESALQKSEQHLRTIIETEPECVTIIDSTGQLLDINGAGLAMLEADSLDALQPRALLHFIVPEYRKAFTTLHAQVLKGQAGALQFEARGLNGAKRWLETHAAPLPSQGGQELMMLAVIRDISAAKQAELALRISESRLMLAIKGSNDAPWDWDLETGQMYFSPQWWHMLGYQENELPCTSQLWQSLVHPDDLAAIQHDLHTAIECGKDTHSVELRLRHKEGHYVPILERSFITRNAQGKVIRITGTNMDLTEQRHAQNLEAMRGFIFECLACEMSLESLLEAVVLKLEELRNDSLCSIMLLDTEGRHLRHGAAPSLPDFYNKVIDGLPVGEGIGCCGHAASTGQAILTDNIAGDPNWTAFKTLADQAGLVSCWSEPILTLNNRILGTLSLYHRIAYLPDNHAKGLIRNTVSLMSIAIERKRAEAQLNLAAQVFEQSGEGFMIADTERNIIRVNHAFTVITGYSEAEIRGQKFLMLASGHHEPGFYDHIWGIVEKQGYWQGEVWHRRKNGEAYPELLSISSVRDKGGNISEYIGIFADITPLKDSEAKLEFLAHHDHLTHLPNRLRLFLRLEHAINAAKRDDHQFALMILDLDRFKDINDSFGHLVGDKLLQQVAARLLVRRRGTDSVCRLGGDEFTVLLEHINHTEDAARVAEEIIADLNGPWSVNNSEVLTGASIGISLYPQHGDTPELLLQNADAALYRAKESGRNRFAYFSNELTIAARDRIELEARLRRAITQDELRVYYQPQIDIASGEMIGAEALVRWQDPVEGLIPPGRFIPVAEQTGLIIALGEWVLKETCRQGSQWLSAGLKPLTLAVNISPQQLRHGDLNTIVSDILKETRFPADHLELELTETGLMERQSTIIELLNKLRTQKIRLAIDDFGTGYSSLAYLKRFPLDVLKIDKSFIDDIPHQQDDMEIAATIIAMGHTLGFKVLAEGVETADQLAFLQEKGCDYFQGYLKSKPLPAEEFAVLLQTVRHTEGQKMKTG